MKCFVIIISVIIFIQYSHLTAQHVLIPGVPDHSQPPAQSLVSTTNISNFCSPFAALNIIEYWELQVQHAYAIGMTAGLPAAETVEYIAWFMDTNDNGSLQRLNGAYGSVNGTYVIDQFDGLMQFIEYDSLQPHGFPYTVPIGKTGHTWDIHIEHNPDFMMVAMELDEGRPLKVDFSHWNILSAGYDTLMQADSIHFYEWGAFVPSSGSQDEQDPVESWNNEEGDLNIGHSVTAVGYLPLFSLPGNGSAPVEYLIVHDNWANTPENVAVPWQNVKAMLTVNLPVVPDLVLSNMETMIDSQVVDTLTLYDPLSVIVTIRNRNQNWLPPCILITTIFDVDGTALLTDTTCVGFAQNKQASDSLQIRLDSLYVAQQTGSLEIRSQVYWDLNADSLINDPPDADPINDYRIISRQVIYQVLYTDIHMIQAVPDFNQPPALSLPSTIPGSFCAPIAATNILSYWDAQALNQTQNVTAGLAGDTLAEYIGWFFDTNNQGNPAAYNGTILTGAAGTYVADQDSNLKHFIRWDSQHPYMAVAPTLPAAKQGYEWLISMDDQQGFPFYQSNIDLGLPLLLNFMHWNVHFSGKIAVDSTDQDTVYLYNWSLPVNNAQLVDAQAPEEAWHLAEDSSSIGHAVTGIGYLTADSQYVVVHDNWSCTHQNVAVPWHWQYWNSTLLADPFVLNRPGDQSVLLPLHSQLMQNYPNPFNAVTTIGYRLSAVSHVELNIYNLLGQKIATLVKDKQKAGHYQVQWDATAYSSGIYYYRITTDAGFMQTRKLVLMK